MDIRRIIRKLKANADILIGKAKYSYSQFGEDLIVDSFFNMGLNQSDITYLDIGTNSPVTGNNTYIFYLRKCKGVCVEPDIHLYKKIVAKRPNDKVLNAGVGINGIKEGVFYYFPEPYTGWNTFSKEEAEQKKIQTGISYKSDRVIPFISINDIIRTNFEKCPDFISIDVEGLDLQILQSLDFNLYQPPVFCIETMEFNNMKLGRKNTQIIDFLENKGYMIYADTYVNTIFVRKDLIQL